MNHFDDIQIEESFGFDFVEQDLAELIEEEHNFSMNEYLNSNYDYKHNCHLGLGMGYICHAHSISKYTLLQKILADPTGPGRR